MLGFYSIKNDVNMNKEYLKYAKNCYIFKIIISLKNIIN